VIPLYPQPFLEYLVQFHAERDYFECHEILEEFWKKAPPSERRPVWVALIQIAVALYHHRRNNLAGARKLLANAIRLAEEHFTEWKELGLDGTRLMALLKQRLQEINSGAPYSSLDLPIADPALKQIYAQTCAARNLPLQRPSDLSNHFLLHKHTLRDRSEVRAERQRQLELRQKMRSGQCGDGES